MKRFQILVFFLFSFLQVSPLLAVEKCIQQDIPSIDLESLDAGTGSISFEDVTICSTINSSLEVTAISGNGIVRYNDFAPTNRPEVTFVASGSHHLEYYADETSMRLLYNGGPVNYLVSGENYEIYFQNLSVTLSLTGEVLEMSGGVTINGQYFDGSSIPYEYFQIF